MPLIRIVLVIITGTSLITGCGWWSANQENDRALAKVHDKYLYERDILPFIQSGLSSEDSLKTATTYINSWIRQQLLLHEAESALPANQKDFSKQLENYRNSLVIYEYESRLLSEKLDTLVTRQEIETYYQANSSDFELRENILKADYMQVEYDSPELRKLRSQWRSGDPTSRAALRQYCIRNGLNYSFGKDEWRYFNDFINEVPVRTYNQEEFLKYNRNFEIRDSLYVYFVEIKDFRIRESSSPMSMQENNIRNIILNRRKLELLQKVQEDIYETAIKNNSFEIYQEN